MPSYNAEKPLVLVDANRNELSRGDVHGQIGLAKRLSAKIGAEMLYIDRDTLDGMYPEIQNTANDSNDNLGRKRVERLQKFFNTHGSPDFIFSMDFNGSEIQALPAEGAGIIVSAINECLPSTLGLKRPYLMVPHHLTPEDLSYSGLRFAEMYEELPRPFIGIAVGAPYEGDMTILGHKLGALRMAYNKASFFICTSHRTKEAMLAALELSLRKTLEGAEDRFPVITFDYAHHAAYSQKNEIWNPYKGMLDQADHIIVTADSMSMAAEAAFTGKRVHCTSGVSTEYMKDMSDCKLGRPLVSESIKAPDLTGACVDKLIESREEQLQLIERLKGNQTLSRYRKIF